MNDIITIDGVKYKRVEEEVRKPVAKYKVGDWVKVIANNKGTYKHAYAGTIAKITYVYDHGEYNREVNNELIPAYSIGKPFVVNEDELEPAEEPKQDPFDIKTNERYYWINSYGGVNPDRKYNDSDPCIEAANACKDQALMEQRALHETLDRLLWRASVQAGELDNPWDGEHEHYIISRDCDDQKLEINSYHYVKTNSIYFPSKESAQSAINNIVKHFMAEHPDFVW